MGPSPHGDLLSSDPLVWTPGGHPRAPTRASRSHLDLASAPSSVRVRARPLAAVVPHHRPGRGIGVTPGPSGLFAGGPASPARTLTSFLSTGHSPDSRGRAGEVAQATCLLRLCPPAFPAPFLELNPSELADAVPRRPAGDLAPRSSSRHTPGSSRLLRGETASPARAQNRSGGHRGLQIASIRGGRSSGRFPSRGRRHRLPPPRPPTTPRGTRPSALSAA